MRTWLELVAISWENLETLSQEILAQGMVSFSRPWSDCFATNSDTSVSKLQGMPNIQGQQYLPQALQLIVRIKA